MSAKWDYWREPHHSAYEYHDMANAFAIELVADRDALAAECAKLREALRHEVIGAVQCYLCNMKWHRHDSPERHAPGCLAAPKS